MFIVTKDIGKLLDQDYADIITFCCPCVLQQLKEYDRNSFWAEALSCQMLFAKLSTQLIEACTPLNVQGTIKDDNVPFEKIDCEFLMLHYTSSLGNADFRARWKVMLEEMICDTHQAAAKKRFNVSEPSFIELYLEYRFSKLLYTFGERHKNEPDLFINQAEREQDTKSIAINDVYIITTACK